MAVFTAMGTVVHRHCLSGATALFHPRVASWTYSRGGTAMVIAMGVAVHRPNYPERGVLGGSARVVHCHTHGGDHLEENTSVSYDFNSLFDSQAV